MYQRSQGDGQSQKPVGGPLGHPVLVSKVETKNGILIDKCHQDDHMVNVKVLVAEKFYQSLGLLCVCGGLEELKLGSCLLWNDTYCLFSVYFQRFHLGTRSWYFFCINGPDLTHM